jgi:predicted ATPase/DNA-binding winged helix-turn-helix (wHTH) protein
VSASPGVSGTAEPALRFGPFSLFPKQRRLYLEGRPVRLGSRALEILVHLVEHSGELVEKEDLISAVWPRTTVDENNLKVHISALRRALGDRNRTYLATVAGRGYRFVAPVEQAGHATAPLPSRAQDRQALPGPLTRLVDRDDAITYVTSQLEQHSFVTITGPGGIGKTRVAVAVAQHFAQVLERDLWFAEFAPVSDAALVPTVVASAIGLDVHSDPLSAVAAYLRNRKGLVVLDNCEHVIAAAAELAEALRRSSDSVAVLATSREPLRADGERVYRLQPLEFPSTAEGLPAMTAVKFPAIELFLERAQSVLGDYTLTDADAPIVAELCRRLDGIALALELAAARSSSLGVRQLANGIDDCLRVLTSGRRTALPRHRTLRAALDWSYDLLNSDERAVFRRLAVFAGGCCLRSAQAVVAENTDDDARITEILAGLVEKSLVSADLESAPVRYRMLETTRLHAAEKLVNAGELTPTCIRHAQFFGQLFEEAARCWEGTSTADWMALYAPELDNQRNALRWAFDMTGDPRVGVQLTATSLGLWLHLSLIHEGQGWIEKALAHIEERTPALTQARLWYAHGRLSGGTRGSFERAVELSRTAGNKELLGRSLTSFGLSVFHQGYADAAEQAFTEAVDVLTGANCPKSLSRALADLAVARINSANLGEARRLLERALNLAREVGDEGGVLRSQVYLAEVEFGLNHVIAAIDRARSLIRLTRATGRTRHLGQALCNLAVHLLSRGEKEDARRAVLEGLPLVRSDEIENIGVVIGIEAAAIIGALDGNCGEAAQLMGYIDKFCRTTAHVRGATEVWGYEHLQMVLSGPAVPDDVALSCSEGSALSEERAIGLALKLLSEERLAAGR